MGAAPASRRVRSGMLCTGQPLRTRSCPVFTGNVLRQENTELGNNSKPPVQCAHTNLTGRDQGEHAGGDDVD